MSFFVRPITSFVQNFVQISNFCPNLIQLLKGIANGHICTDFQDCMKNAAFPYIMVDLFH